MKEKERDFHTRLQLVGSESEFKNLLRSPGIDSQPCGPVRQPYLTYRPARLHTGCRNRFLGSLNVYKYGLRVFSHGTGKGVVRKLWKHKVNNCRRVTSMSSLNVCCTNRKRWWVRFWQLILLFSNCQWWHVYSVNTVLILHDWKN